MPIRSLWTERLTSAVISTGHRSPLSVHHTRRIVCGYGTFDMHYGLEMGIVLAGRVRRFFPGLRRDLRPGGVWLCGMWEPHGYQVLAAPCDIVVAVIQPELLVNLRLGITPPAQYLGLFTAPPAVRPSVPRREVPDVLACGRKLVDLARTATAHRDARAWLAVLQILALLEENRPPAPPSPSPTGPVQKLNPAILAVFDRRGRISTVAAARIAGLAPTRFARLFRSLMGVPFAQFGLRYRLHQAARQLVTTDDPLKKVAADWDFADPSHFLHTFKKHYGCTPGAHRRRHTPPSHDRSYSGS